VAGCGTGGWYHDLPELWAVACCQLATEPPGVVELA